MGPNTQYLALITTLASKAKPTSNRIKCTLLHTSADPETRDFECESKFEI
jgi:hypothetical protein